jgi:hypothetical protein
MISGCAFIHVIAQGLVKCNFLKRDIEVCRVVLDSTPPIRLVIKQQPAMSSPKSGLALFVGLLRHDNQRSPALRQTRPLKAPDCRYSAHDALKMDEHALAQDRMGDEDG